MERSGGDDGCVYGVRLDSSREILNYRCEIDFIYAGSNNNDPIICEISNCSIRWSYTNKIYKTNCDRVVVKTQ